MKNKQTIHIQEDETFLEGINLITGLKINYDRPILVTFSITLDRLKLNLILCVLMRSSVENKKLSKFLKADKCYRNGHCLIIYAIIFINLQNMSKFCS